MLGLEPRASCDTFTKPIRPKNPQHKLNDKDLDNESKMKKVLLTALLHYHPDKQDKEHGMKWATLCEEITKLLNGHYERNKFPPSESDDNDGDDDGHDDGAGNDGDDGDDDNDGDDDGDVKRTCVIV